MPTYLPPRLGVTLSEAIAKSMASATIGDPLLTTLELYRDGWLDDDGNQTAARVVNDFRPLNATLEAGALVDGGTEVTFAPVPFKFVKPEQTDSGAPVAVQVEIDNVSRVITELLVQDKTNQTPIYLTEREYLPSDTSAPHVLPPLRLVLSGVEAGETSVTAQASFGDLTNRKFPVDYYTRERFPALGAR